MKHKTISGFAPVRITEVELTRALPDFAPVPSLTGETYGRLLILIRLHGVPLGMIAVDLRDGEVDANELARLIWAKLSTKINGHLSEDGIGAVDELTVSGIGHDSQILSCGPKLDSSGVPTPFVSVIIPTRDRADQLRRCLLSLLESDYPSGRFEAIIVDNGSTTSATRDLVTGEFAGDPRLRYIREEMSGSASARNAGALVARGSILAFTDDDVRIDREWIMALASAFSLVPNVGCVTGLILPMEIETPAQLLLEEYGGFAKGFERRIYDLDEYRPDIPTFPFSAGMFGSGQSMAFSAEAFSQMGGFDPALGNGTPALGGVDIEMLFRTVVAGFRLVYEPRAIVHHANYRDYERLRRQVYMYGVGLTAFLTRSLVERPGLLVEFLRRLPSGLHYALSSSSQKHAGKSGSYPAALRRLELIGMLYGPLAYVRSARQFGWPSRGLRRSP